ncbi:MAG: hypothetical protein A2Z47_15375 [Thermodesulfovibrio sp. RBG_19FT_COMBO_42_12]|nr:MAG: hypothetical protein A2Z47_15375 [Thermodesulfovibrio sp. RBG_19FT_COMBO_42_12]
MNYVNLFNSFTIESVAQIPILSLIKIPLPNAFGLGMTESKGLGMTFPCFYPFVLYAYLYITYYIP